MPLGAAKKGLVVWGGLFVTIKDLLPAQGTIVSIMGGL